MNSREHSEYLLNRGWIWEKLREKRELIDRVSERGVVTEDETRVIQSICCFILSDMDFEDQAGTIPFCLN